jgi:hypothetical protein
MCVLCCVVLCCVVLCVCVRQCRVRMRRDVTECTPPMQLPRRRPRTSPAPTEGGRWRCSRSTSPFPGALQMSCLCVCACACCLQPNNGVIGTSVQVCFVVPSLLRRIEQLTFDLVLVVRVIVNPCGTQQRKHSHISNFWQARAAAAGTIHMAPYEHSYPTI